MPAGRHGHRLREFMRRADRLLEVERERRRPLGPPPPPISAAHTDLRRRIAELYRTLLDDSENPQGTDQMKKIEERMDKDPELAMVAAELVALQHEECALLYKNGVDYHPYDVSRLE